MRWDEASSRGGIGVTLKEENGVRCSDREFTSSSVAVVNSEKNQGSLTMRFMGQGRSYLTASEPYSRLYVADCRAHWPLNKTLGEM